MSIQKILQNLQKFKKYTKYTVYYTFLRIKILDNLHEMCIIFNIALKTDKEISQWLKRSKR